MAVTVYCTEIAGALEAMLTRGAWELRDRVFLACSFHSSTVVTLNFPLLETRSVPSLKDASSYFVSGRLLVSRTERPGLLSRWLEQYSLNEAFESPEILEALALEVSDIVE